jgi:hypothetical protein
MYSTDPTLKMVAKPGPIKQGLTDIESCRAQAERVYIPEEVNDECVLRRAARFLAIVFRVPAFLAQGSKHTARSAHAPVRSQIRLLTRSRDMELQPICISLAAPAAFGKQD